MRSTLQSLFSTLFAVVKKNLLASFLVVLCLFSQASNVNAQSSNSIVTCPEDIVQNNDLGLCSAKVTFPTAVASQPNFSVRYSKPSGAPFPVGTTKVVMEVRDVNGVSVSTCNFNVTVIDKEAPVLSSCPADIQVNNTKDSCGALVQFTMPTVFEKCTYQQKTFDYSGAPASFIVPVGVTSLSVDVKGAAGGHTYSNGSVYGTSGLGGEVEADIPVIPGQTLFINVGGAGQNGSASSAGIGGFNGGGDGAAAADNNVVSYGAGGGGGASDIRISDNTFANRIIVAGGGGAAGITQAGGNGGDLSGANGAGGASFATGGSQTQGGAGANYENEFFAENGDLGIGGKGAGETPGGGGGGGLYGGGGGSFSSGAGGSSYTYADATNVYHTQGVQEGNGSVTLSWSQPATLEQTSGLPSGSMFPIGQTINTFTATDASGNMSSCTFTVAVTDSQKPAITLPADQIFTTKANVYNIPALTANDNCGVGSITYSIDGATVRNGSDADASGTFNPGTSVISWTVTDTHGNIQTGSTSVNLKVASPITGNIPDVYAVSPGGKPNTIFIGYGPSYLLLKALPNGGKGTYTYEWIKTGSKIVLSRSQTLFVFLPGEYSVTVTDATGSSAVFKKQIQVIDVRCGNKDDKVMICKGKGNSKDRRSLCISENAVEAQLAKGGFLGECTENIYSARVAVLKAPEVVVERINKFVVYPNPTSGQFTVSLNNYTALKAEVVLFSQNGMTLQKRTVELNEANQKISFNISNLAPGIYIVRVSSNDGIQTAKILLQH